MWIEPQESEGMHIVDVTSAALYGMDCKMSLTFVAEKVYFILKKVYKMSFLYHLYPFSSKKRQ